MSDISDLTFSIKPKSDQLNADDLLISNKIITVSAVRTGNNESPVIINYQADDGRPYKPCKSMRRVLIAAWGRDGNKWIGRSMELYCDPSVKWAGQEVGGIRIKALTDLPQSRSSLIGKLKRMVIKLTTSRGRKIDYPVDELQLKQRGPYKDFELGLVKMKEYIESGEMTAEQVIARCEENHVLTEEQRATIRQIEKDFNNK